MLIHREIVQRVKEFLYVSDLNQKQYIAWWYRELSREYSASMCGQQEDSGDEHDQVDTNDKEYYDRLMVDFVFYYHEPWTYFVLIKIQYDISSVLCKFESRRTR
jgi:hypothetical protein